MKILGEIDIDPLLKSQAFLEMGLREANTELEKAGTIQAFEIAYELAWKTMKRVLAFRGLEAASPREVFRQAALEKIIADPEVWFDFIVKRNSTVHIYNRKVAEDIFKFLPQFSAELSQMIRTLQELKK